MSDLKSCHIPSSDKISRLAEGNIFVGEGGWYGLENNRLRVDPFAHCNFSRDSYFFPRGTMSSYNNWHNTYSHHKTGLISSSCIIHNPSMRHNNLKQNKTKPKSKQNQSLKISIRVGVSQGQIHTNMPNMSIKIKPENCNTWLIMMIYGWICVIFYEGLMNYYSYQDSDFFKE